MQGASPLASPAFNRLRHLQTLPFRCSAGGVLSLSPTEPAAAVPGGGRRGWLPSIPAFSLLFCPHPPDPLPGGKGETFYFISPGADAPGTPAAEPGRRWLFLWKTVPQGGLVPGVAGWLCCTGAQGGGLSFASPAYHAICLPFFPHPPVPLPLRGRGRLFTLFRRGLAPPAPLRLNPRFAAKTAGSNSLRAVPAAKERGDRGRGTSAFEMVLSPGAGRTSAAGGLVFRLACLPCHLFAFFPHPPAPLPSGKGEPLGYFMQGASPLASPAFNRLRHLQTLPFRCPGQACHGTGHEPAFMKIIGKSSWGFGGFFQEAPNASPFYSFSNAARVQAGFKTHSRSG